jgi:hypothetical protein
METWITPIGELLECHRCLRFARALVDIMDSIPDHDIAGETGLPPVECDRIARARADALEYVKLRQVDVKRNQLG